MDISSINATKAVEFLGLKNNQTIQKVTDTVMKGITDIFSKSDETEKFKNIVDKYDITNISKKDAQELYKELYDNNLISLKEMVATFDYSKLPGFKNGVTTVNGVKITSNPDDKINLLEQLKSQADYNSKYGNRSQQKIFEERLHLAEKIYYFQT